MQAALIRSVVILLLSAAPAEAATFPCPRVTIGWSKQWTGFPITSASYETAAKVLYVSLSYTTPEAYAQVPVSVINLFSNTQNPYQVYLSTRSQYPQIVLTQKDNCPILQQNGRYVYTNTVPLNYFLVLMKETYGPLLQETGNYLFLEKPAPSVGPYVGLAQENYGLIVQENSLPILWY